MFSIMAATAFSGLISPAHSSGRYRYTNKVEYDEAKAKEGREKAAKEQENADKLYRLANPAAIPRKSILKGEQINVDRHEDDFHGWSHVKYGRFLRISWPLGNKPRGEERAGAAFIKPNGALSVKTRFWSASFKRIKPNKPHWALDIPLAGGYLGKGYLDKVWSDCQNSHHLSRNQCLLKIQRYLRQYCDNYLPHPYHPGNPSFPKIMRTHGEFEWMKFDESDTHLPIWIGKSRGIYEGKYTYRPEPEAYVLMYPDDAARPMSCNTNYVNFRTTIKGIADLPKDIRHVVEKYIRSFRMNRDGKEFIKKQDEERRKKEAEDMRESQDEDVWSTGRSTEEGHAGEDGDHDGGCQGITILFIAGMFSVMLLTLALQ